MSSSHSPGGEGYREGRLAPEYVRATRLLYLVLAAAWIVLVAALGLFDSNGVGLLVLSVPLAIFFLGFAHADGISAEPTVPVLQADNLTIGLLVVVPLLTWMSRGYNGNRQRFMRLLFTAIIISLIATIDLCVRPPWCGIIRHIRASMQAAAIALLVYALYIYYSHAPQVLFDS